MSEVLQNVFKQRAKTVRAFLNTAVRNDVKLKVLLQCTI